MYTKKMKKVFALLTIVTVMSFVACKNKPAHDDKADSIRRADSIHRADSIAAEEARAKAEAEAAATPDSLKGDSANMNNGTTTN